MNSNNCHHPLDPLTAEEIRLAVTVVRKHVRTDAVIFKAVTLSEPLKKEMTLYLENEHEGRKNNTPPVRTVLVLAYVDKVYHDLVVNIENASVLKMTSLPGRVSRVDAEHSKKCAEACLANKRVKEKVAQLKLPREATVIAEPWTYATDGVNDMTRRITMCWLYMRLSQDPDSNYYQYPLDICAEVTEDMEVLNVFKLPSAQNDEVEADGHHQAWDRAKIHQGSEYHPKFVRERRTTTLPYQVTQPQGPSFRTEGNQIRWEKWTMRVGWNYREGMTLHDIYYDGKSLFYRLSLAEMFVPYGDPRCPFPRKAAFDLGNDGAGICANNLKLGCDCLGHIKYFDGWLVSDNGIPLHMPNVICCHEVDDGILWKHTSFRTGNAVVTRSRLLVLQTIITVANYEYIFLFYFGQDASIHYEVRATGILSVAPINIGDSVPWGTIVAPGVQAAYHQHLFCLRIDPAIAGHKNSLVVEESHVLPIDDTQVHNPFGVGYTTRSAAVTEEVGLDLDHTTARVFKIVNETEINPTTRTPVGFKLLPSYSQLLLAHPSSFHARRSEFGAHAVWVTRHSDDEMFASGNMTVQSSGGEGIASWIAGRKQGPPEDRSVQNEDIVVWHTFGMTHNPRIEDWPVMPCEKIIVGLKPVNFFDWNPAIDVQLSSQETNQSVLVEDREAASMTSCCTGCYNAKL